MLFRVRLLHWLVAGALVGVAVLAMFLAPRHLGPESDPSDPPTSIQEVLQQARVAVLEPQDAGIHTLMARGRIATYLLGQERTRAPWIAYEVLTWYEAPDRKRVAIEFAVEAEAPGGSAIYSRTEVWDGTDLWTHHPGSSAVTVRRQEQWDSASWLGDLFGAAPSTIVTTDGTPSPYCATPALTGERMVAGRDAWVVEFSRPHCGLALPGQDGRKVVWIDKATGLGLGGESYAADGRLYGSAEITHLMVNGTIDSDTFRLVAPGDAALSDYRGLSADWAPLVLLALPQPLSLAQAKAEATFDVLVPTGVPRGFAIESIEHYWGNDQAQALRSHADWVRLRYTNAAGDWLVIEQGFGGPLALFATAAPDSASQGVVRIKGANARWIDGNPATGWEPGVMVLLYIEGGQRGTGGATWPASGTVLGSSFHVVLASNALTAEELVVVAELVQ